MRQIKTVRLNGKDYEIDSEGIKKVCSRLEPKAIEKYWVKVDGRRLPPKQIVSELLDVKLVDFTTMDASRVLGAVGFKVLSETDKTEPLKTESEILLEEYLRSHGLIDFEFEPNIPGTTKKPDYLLSLHDTKVLLEVKEFVATADDFRLGAGAYDPYGPIREKIGAARKKFKDLEGYCCCLVLHNHQKPIVSLEWRFIMGAMLGDLGFSFPVNLRTGQGDMTQMKQTTLGGGKMHKHQAGTPFAPENQTISAVIVVERFLIGEKRFQLYIHEREQALGRELEVKEFLELANQSAGTERDLTLNRIRLRVHENPYARIPLDRRLFNGPFDERYGAIEDTGKWGRVFLGAGAADFEKKSPTARLLSRS
jgi:hypothetical protein